MSGVLDISAHHFEILLADGTRMCERETVWSSISKHKTVKYFGMKKEVLLSKIPIVHIDVYHEGLETSLEVPDGCRVYTAFRSQMIVAGGGKHTKILGRCVGIVKDGEVIEERFLNGVEQQVYGMKL